MQQQQLTDLLRFIKNTDSDQSDLAATVLKLAADSITLDTLRSLTGSAVSGKKEVSEEEKTGTLSFTKKELESMPKSFQKAFIYDNRIVKFRYYQGLFQARYRRQGYNIEVASKDFDTMKKKFIEKLIGQAEVQDIPVADPKRRTAKTVLFADYAKDWLKLKEQTTKPSTFKEYSRMFEVNLRPTFGHLHLSEITRPLVQQYLFTFVEAGKYRTAEKLKLMLNCIFDMAAEDFSIPSPMKKVVLPSYQVRRGQALTADEEERLVKYCKAHKEVEGTDALLVLLFFGLRKSELASIEIIDGKWLQCETSKERLGQNVVLRKIPFTPQVKKVLPFIDFEKAKNTNLNTISTRMKRLLPERHPHELRHTFISRCKECGVASEVVSIWAGHSLSGTITSTVYTHYSDEFQLKEAEKVIY